MMRFLSTLLSLTTLWSISSHSSCSCLAASNYQPQKKQPHHVPTTTQATPPPSSSQSEKIPVIDLSSSDDEELAQQIASACSTYGFFHVVGHGVSQDLIEQFREQCRLYFDLESSFKTLWKRNATNARGFFDDELTQQRRDWKQCLDVGVPGSRSWDLEDGHPLNGT